MTIPHLIRNEDECKCQLTTYNIDNDHYSFNKHDD